MPKRIIILCGSPNEKGNTNTVVKWVNQGAKEEGAEVEIINAAKLTYKTNGCTACMGCQKSDKYECVIKDEASPIIARIPENDIVIFATPLYFFGPSAQLKLLMDRMYSLFKFNRHTGKITHNMKHMTFGLISTAASEIFSPLEDMFKQAADFVGVKLETLLIPFAGQRGEIKGNNAIKEEAIDFGKDLAG